IDQIPDGGICLSAFVMLSPPGKPNHVLMGKLNPGAPWEHLGALDRERAEANSKGWMLPSSHLILFESPQETATRILTEQLSINDQKLTGPYVFSEVYGPKNHWDLEFVFTGERDDVPKNDAWSELRFVDTNATKREDIVRSHEDVLAHAGRWEAG
ncbi:MAG: NUDIX hydrolase, partial [Nitrososphaerota archaeon]|nr:NUDIX hydrolase [Nitrososphaerota archaeon]